MVLVILHGILCLFLGSGGVVSSEPRCRFMLSGYGVKGIFLGECNGDEVGETDSHGEDGWGFFLCFVPSAFCRVLGMELS